MVKFSDNYIKWGVTAVLIGSIAFCAFVCTELIRTKPADAWSGYLLVAVVLALDVVILVCCKDIAYRTVVVGNTGVREKVFSKVTKEYPWDAVIACGVCSRWVGSYWQYLMFFSDKPVTEKARYGREKDKGKRNGHFHYDPVVHRCAARGLHIRSAGGARTAGGREPSRQYAGIAKNA